MGHSAGKGLPRGQDTEQCEAQATFLTHPVSADAPCLSPCPQHTQLLFAFVTVPHAGTGQQGQFQAKAMPNCKGSDQHMGKN